MRGSDNNTHQRADGTAEQYPGLHRRPCPDGHTAKDWYTTGELAEILCKAEFTVREWCRLARSAEKKSSGRGKYQSWVVSHEELLRIQKEGLLPPRDNRS